MTQGLVTIVRKEKVLFKIVAGNDGFKAKALANEIKKHPGILTIEVLYGMALHVGFGCTDCLVVQSKDMPFFSPHIAHDTFTHCLYLSHSKFNDPKFNPRWGFGTAAYTEIVDIEPRQEQFS